MFAQTFPLSLSLFQAITELCPAPAFRPPWPGGKGMLPADQPHSVPLILTDTRAPGKEPSSYSWGLGDVPSLPHWL